MNDSSDIKRIAFASDTQAPMLIETLLLRSHKNKLATQLLFENVWQQHPHTLFLLGDVVNLGYSNRQWKPIDKYLEALRNKQINIHAILGNHEVMGRAVLGQQKFQNRFPDHVRTGYLKVVDGIAILMLNSNFGTLSKKEDITQVQWYQNALQQLDDDPCIEFVITCCHHSPFTNSRIVSPSIAVQQKFVPHFLHAKKSQLFLSGHCHAFEHYKVSGKDFMVIGGGGGLRQPLRQGIGTLYDLASKYKPMFHYLMAERSAEHLHLFSYHLKKDFSGFEEGWKIEIKKYAETAIAEGHIINSAR